MHGIEMGPCGLVTLACGPPTLGRGLSAVCCSAAPASRGNNPAAITTIQRLRFIDLYVCSSAQAESTADLALSLMGRKPRPTLKHSAKSACSLGAGSLTLRWPISCAQIQLFAGIIKRWLTGMVLASAAGRGLPLTGDESRFCAARATH